MNLNMDPNGASPWFTGPPEPTGAYGSHHGPGSFQSPPGSQGGVGVSGTMGASPGGYYGGGGGGGGSDQGDDEFANEPPLLEELGINFEHIWVKTQSVLLPTKKINEHILDDADLAGPLVFCFVFGMCLLLVRSLVALIALS